MLDFYGKQQGKGKGKGKGKWEVVGFCFVGGGQRILGDFGGIH